MGVELSERMDSVDKNPHALILTGNSITVDALHVVWSDLR